MRLPLLSLALLSICAPAFSQRVINPNDVYRFKSVSDPQPSPDGQWVAYTVSTPDSAKDKTDSNIWMVSIDGSQSVQLTSSSDSESMPRWSPDGKYLTFLSKRQDAKTTQLWRMDRRGGEASQLTKLKVGISSYSWSPDSRRLVLVIKDQEKEEDDDAKKKTKKPIMIDRYHFKQDGQGYLERKRNHLYVLDLETQKLDTLTTGDFDNSQPEWSPDSRQVVFVSNRTADADRNDNTDMWVVEAKQGAVPRQLTSWSGSDESPAWSPDGKSIAYLRSRMDVFDAYDQPQLAVISANGGTPAIVSAALDRDISLPSWSVDGKSIHALVTDNRKQYVATFEAVAGAMKIVTEGDVVFRSLTRASGSTWVALGGDAVHPFEVYAVAASSARKLTSQHDEFLKPLSLASVENFSSTSKDGTEVYGLLHWPAGKPKEEKLPLVLWIHGGPMGQDDYSFDLISQELAANGYAVANVNYRGSNGRGLEYSRTIYADWGNKEVTDLQGAVDHLIATGRVDADKLMVGGWSYGGILTDYITTRDSRFKAAASGAGSALWFSYYGSDQYIRQYENELGLPWKNMDKWMELSYPFFEIEKIKTPTLYMVGEKDFNVPPIGSEQMYQALKTLGVPTELIIYPDQNHGISTPSYQVDRLTRYNAWFAKYLKSGP